MTLTIHQLKTMIRITRSSGSLSVFGSSIMLWDIIKTGNIKRQCRLRILAGISIFDILASIPFICGPYLLPKNSEDKKTENTRAQLNAQGNEYTCQAQAFLLSLYLVSIGYNLCLAMYYILVVKYGVSELWLSSKVEKWMHLFSLGYGIAASLAMLPFGLDLYVPRTSMCQADVNNEKLFADLCYAYFTITAIVVITILMIILYISVRKEEGTVKKFWSSRSRWSSRTVIHANVSRKVASQCFAFSIIFYIVYVPVVLGRRFDLCSAENSTYSFCILLSLLSPLQGFLNAAVYFRSRIVCKILSVFKGCRKEGTEESPNE